MAIQLGTHLRVLYYPIYTNMTGFRWYSKNLCVLIYWVKVALALEGLRASLVVEAMLHHINTYSYMYSITWSTTQSWRHLLAMSETTVLF